MGTGSRELIATNESAVTTEPILDPIVVEDSEGYSRLPDPSCTYESGGYKVFRETDNPLDQVFTAEAG